MRGNRAPVPRVEKLGRAVHVAILERDLQNNLFYFILLGTRSHGL
jgi:hypothetical protein